jgi:hypothetical protein
MNMDTYSENALSIRNQEEENTKIQQDEDGFIKLNHKTKQTRNQVNPQREAI